ncbi:oxygenase MpaB family protein [Nocardioides marmoribigeumensis]|uniref:ER-bound oxygenase mpaB/mpaB'/Rubber oxygenase catalytic domain-containing protein n=1 Tax=Nocardioides marmoribigeumensis TaxID=433649 RepID=A0ABU2BSY0_9ACTN|nr:oxygenase MpaB family protein [Nocardioides marmoribigeumensis]MDR7361741.1 hypothetical protein [Nocardioides marmoribigeumensis]
MHQPTLLDTVPHPSVVSDPSTVLGRHFSDLVDEATLRPDPRQVEEFRSHAHCADPLADDVVEAMATDGPTVRAAVEAALARGCTPSDDDPDPVRELFARTAATPYWVDLRQVEAGQRALARAGILGLMSLGSLALMGGYLSRRSIKPLVRTGELDAMAPRRLTETAAWWLEVTTPGSLRPGGKGVESVLRVRLTHAHVRRWMHRRPDWDYESWDAPVNQIQMAGTHLLFSIACLGGLQRLGVRYDARERAAVMHLWRYVGWLMGIEDALLPATEADGWRLFWLMAATELDPDEDSRALADALTRSSGLAAADAPDLVVQAGLAFNAGMSRYLLGDWACDVLGLQRSRGGALAVRAFTRGVAAAELGRRVVPGGTRVAGLVGGATRRRFIERAASALDADRSYGRDHLTTA